MKGNVITMPVNKAKKHYLGQDGFNRMNCALSIAYGFKDELMLEECFLSSFKAYGSGRAPNGECGALFATKSLISIIDKDKIQDFEKYFCELTGSVKCSEVRKNKKLSCVGCVEKSSEYLNNLKTKK